MKKITIILFGVMFAALAIAQPAPRQKVIVEIGTGTWCVFCPGASMGAQDLIDNGHDVAIIKYHSGDSYANSFSNARTSYYNMQGYPTTVFDGSLTHVGGNPNNSIYPTYLPLYNQSISVPSPFTIDLSVDHISGLQYQANVLISNVSDFSASNLVLHLAVTETDIPHNWFNQTHVKDVLRLMVPNQNGTSLDFNGTDEILLQLTFNLQSSWVEENMHVVAFVQDVPTKEIFQGEIVALISTTVAFNFENEQTDVDPIPQIDAMFPEPVTFLNGRPITNENASDLIEFYIHEEEEKDAVEFTATINDDNNIISITPDEPLDFLTTYVVEIHPVLGASGMEIAAGMLVFTTRDTYGTPEVNISMEDGAEDVSLEPTIEINTNQTVRHEDGSEITPESLHQLFIFKDDNDGPVVFLVTMNEEATEFSITPDGELQYETTYHFEVNPLMGIDGQLSDPLAISFTTEEEEDDPVNINEVNFLHVSVYPNPVNDILNIDLNDFTGQGILMIYNTNGQLMKRVALNQEKHSINVSGLKDGVYVMAISYNEKTYYDRFTKISN